VAKPVQEKLEELAAKRRRLVEELRSVRFHESSLLKETRLERLPEYIELTAEIKSSKTRLRELQRQMDSERSHIPYLKSKIHRAKLTLISLQNEEVAESKAYDDLIAARNELEREALGNSPEHLQQSCGSTIEEGASARTSKPTQNSSGDFEILD
jgi:hypothetical protein